MNQIEDYRFGVVRIAGREYTVDLIIYANRIREGWWRKAGHSLCADDLQEVVDAGISLLVVGTGYHGRMEIPAQTRSWLTGHGVDVHDFPTQQACQEFNRLLQTDDRQALAAALHLTC